MMKRLFCLTLALLMLCGMMTACNQTDKPDETTTEATTTETTTTETTTTETTTEQTTTEETTTEETTTKNKPVVESYAVFNYDGVSFSYPASWQKIEGTVSMVVDVNTGSNITVAKEPAGYDYSKLTTELFKDEMLAAFQASGIDVQAVSVAQSENALGTKMTVLSMIVESQGIVCPMTQYIVMKENYTHIIAITEVGNGVGIVRDTLFDTLAVTEVAVPTGSNVYDNWAIAFEYPAAWSETSSSGVTVLTDSLGGDNINIVSEPLTDVYQTITAEEFADLLRPSVESAGMAISNLSVEKKVNANGVSMMEVKYDLSYLGINMAQTMFIVNAGPDTYTITVTEVSGDTDLPETVFNTLQITYTE